MIQTAFFLLLLILCTAYPLAAKPDIIIVNARIFDALHARIDSNRVIFIEDGVISSLENSDYPFSTTDATTVIDARGRLVTPGFIEASSHLDDVFGDSVNAVIPDPGLFEKYRAQFSSGFLPYGVTTVHTSGDCEAWLPVALHWMKNPVAGAPDFFSSGGSLVGAYDGTPYINHVLLKDPAEATAKLRSYHSQGISHIKIYGNGAMDHQIAGAIMDEASRLGMNVSGQVQFGICIDSMLSLGLKNFEHASTLCYQSTVFDYFNDEGFDKLLRKYWYDKKRKSNKSEGERIYPFLEAANYAGPDNRAILSTLAGMKAHHATMTTSLHFFAQWLGLSYFTSKPKAKRFETADFTKLQKERCLKGYAILAGYVKRMFEMGIPLVMGVDHKDGGKAVLSEMILLHDAGIPAENVLQIATINTARAIGRERQYGSIEKGKRANLVLFEKSPLEDIRNLLSAKTVIKDGVVYRDTISGQ